MQSTAGMLLLYGDPTRPKLIHTATPTGEEAVFRSLLAGTFCTLLIMLWPSQPLDPATHCARNDTREQHPQVRKLSVHNIIAYHVEVRERLHTGLRCQHAYSVANPAKTKKPCPDLTNSANLHSTRQKPQLRKLPFACLTYQLFYTLLSSWGQQQGCCCCMAILPTTNHIKVITQSITSHKASLKNKNTLHALLAGFPTLYLLHGVNSRDAAAVWEAHAQRLYGT